MTKRREFPPETKFDLPVSDGDLSIRTTAKEYSGFLKTHFPEVPQEWDRHKLVEAYCRIKSEIEAVKYEYKLNRAGEMECANCGSYDRRQSKCLRFGGDDMTSKYSYCGEWTARVEF